MISASDVDEVVGVDCVNQSVFVIDSSEPFAVVFGEPDVIAPARWRESEIHSAVNSRNSICPDPASASERRKCGEEKRTQLDLAIALFRRVSHDFAVERIDDVASSGLRSRGRHRWEPLRVLLRQ